MGPTIRLDVKPLDVDEAEDLDVGDEVGGHPDQRGVAAELLAGDEPNPHRKVPSDDVVDPLDEFLRDLPRELGKGEVHSRPVLVDLAAGDRRAEPSVDDPAQDVERGVMTHVGETSGPFDAAADRGTDRRSLGVEPVHDTLWPLDDVGDPKLSPPLVGQHADVVRLAPPGRVERGRPQDGRRTVGDDDRRLEFGAIRVVQVEVVTAHGTDLLPALASPHELSRSLTFVRGKGPFETPREGRTPGPDPLWAGNVRRPAAVSDTGSLLRTLACRACSTEHDPSVAVGPCPRCGHTLFAEYSLEKLDGRAWVASLRDRGPSLWRYRELLPVGDSEAIASLGEGSTPILPLPGVPEAPEVDVRLKDDGGLPTGSFKARGMAVAVSRARELGLRQLFVPSAGNAGVALAAYGARAGASVRVYLPETTPAPMRAACALFGAEVVAVPGTIREAGEAARERERRVGSFDMSTLREPYRLEGKKTMGLEIFEQTTAETFPNVIVYPTGGGTGLVGMAKAFEELGALGLLDRVPRLYAVQPEGCAPVVRALLEGADRIRPWESARTVAPGLKVPAPFASERILEAVRASRGGGVTVSDREIVRSMRALASRYGISASPEAAAPYAALEQLVRRGTVRSGERVLLYGTGTGLAFSVEALEREIVG